MTAAPALIATDMRVRYGSKWRFSRNTARDAVRDVTVSAPLGTITGIVGESGSGKSSLGLAIAGLNPGLVAGDVTIQKSPESGAGKPTRADVQVIFQDPVGALDPRQSIRSGLAELRRLYPGRSDQSTIDEVVDRVGFPTNLLDRYPHQLSGGQCQRICIARAIMLRPLAIIADEPTSSLDVSVQARVLALMSDLCGQANLAIVLITHDIAVVRQVCRDMYVMNAGCIVESGKTDDVLSHPKDAYTQRLLASVPGSEFTKLTRGLVATSTGPT